ncbi:MAG: MarR family transcriptional regulator [Myxococcota bacterium]
MDDHELAILLDRLMRRFGAGIHQRARTVDVHGVGPLGGMLLTQLAEMNPARLSDLVSSMHRDKSQMTRVVRRLEQSGLLMRSQDPDDGRAVVVSLTPAGLEQVRVIREVMSDVVGELFKPLDDESRATLLDVLRQL